MSKKNIVRERLSYIALIIIVIGIVISILLLFKFHKWYFFIPTLYYYSSLRIDEGIRHTSEILGGISLAVTMIIFVKIFFIKTIKRQYILSFFGLGFSLLCYLLFFILAPGYTFEKYPEYFMYMDDKKEYIENVERYIYLVDSFGFYQSTYRPFKTLDDAIQGLEFAKGKKNGLYGYIFRDLKNFGLLNVVQNIKDEDIYEDIMFEIIGVDYRDGEYNWEKESVEFFVKNLDVITYITQNTHNNKLKNVGMYVLEKYAKYQNGEINAQDMFSKIYLESKEIYQN